MSRDRGPPPERQVTTDANTVRRWGEPYDLIPIRYEEGGETRLALVGESDVEEEDDRLDWDEFEGELRQRGLVVVRTGETNGDVTVADRTEAVGAAGISPEAAEGSLIDDEPSESMISDRPVVEHTVVEAVTVESRITDRELVESDTVAAELVDRDPQACAVTNVDWTDTGAEALEAFGTGARSEISCDVAVTLDEEWAVTKETVERITVESRILDTDAAERDTSDTVREAVDVAGVERTVLEGELVDSEGAAEPAVAEGSVESRFRSDDAIETQLLRRQLLEERLRIRREVTGEVSDAETMTAETVSQTPVESEIVDAGDYADELAVGRSPADRRVGPEDTGTPATDEATTGEGLDRIVPTEADVGKTVVNASGDEVGMVAAVEDERLYVDPHPTITGRIRTALGWASHATDSYPVDEDHVARIEDDAVVLGVDRRG